ncbi:MAG TPA: hypothetical protein VFJ72_13790 [Rubrobacteraceae bacterium]|nr:hypothetical protein [Rubrobacteraceae bacterium]
MKHISFVPLVEEISPEEAGKTPEIRAVVSYWTEGSSDAAEWFEELNGEFGTVGLMMRRGEELLGYLVYAPRRYLPRAGRYPLGPLDGETVLLAYVAGEQRARRHLLVRMLRDLRYRNVGKVEAVASDIGLPGHVSTRFLIESGWRPVRGCLYRGLPYTLARTDLASVVEVGDLARGLLGRVKLPNLKGPYPLPGAFVRTVEEPEPARAEENPHLGGPLRPAGSRS